LEPGQAAPRRQQRFLQDVLGVLHRAEDPVAVQLKFAAVGVGQLAERAVVPAPRPLQRRLGHHGNLLFPYRHHDRQKVIDQPPSSPVSEPVTDHEEET
jgi:hypothetical protein